MKSIKRGRLGVLGLAAVWMVVGCGDDGHSHGPGDGHHLGESGALLSQVVEAACGEADAETVVDVPGRDDPGGMLVVPTDGVPLRLRAPDAGPVRVQFAADIDHGNWRILAGHEATLVDLLRGDRSQRVEAARVTDETCQERWNQTFFIHTHGENLYTVELAVDAGAEFWFAVKLESVGH